MLADILGKLSKISDNLREVINYPIIVGEVKSVIKRLLRNKSPGPYGIVSEFYHAFEARLSPILPTVFEDARRKDATSLYAK